MAEDTDLKAFIHDKYEQLFSDWTAEFPFPSYLEGLYSDDWDLLMFVGKKNNKKNVVHVEFDSDRYPITGGFDGDGFQSLSNDLCRASMSNGFNLIRNGNYPYNGNRIAKRFSCSRCSKYRGNTTQRASLTFRDITYHCDRKNSRGKNGLTMPRRSKTLRSLCKENCCSFFFLVGLSIEKKCFYVVSGYGKTIHQKHPQISKECITYPPRLLSDDDKKLIEHIKKGDANCGVIANVVFQKTGLMLSRQNCAYIGGLCNELKDLPDLTSKSTTEIMISYLEKSNHDFMVLMHDPVVQAIRAEATMASGEQVQPAHLNFSQHEKLDVNDFVIKSRNATNCTDTQNLMMGFAWVLPCERRLFEMFPEVLTVDCTSDTNNESRPLLTMNAKDSNGKMFTVLRAFLPNEQAWVFRWVFSCVLPKMFGLTIINKIQVVISDGDSREYEQIDNAIRMYMPNVYRSRCGWHIVEKGWQNKVLGVLSFSEEHHAFYYKVVKQLKAWMYSWMKMGCESQAEYEYSLKVFKLFLKSKEIKEKLTDLFSKSVLLFLKNNVLTQESYYVFYQRVFRRHYEEYSNSIHEGTNRGLKYNAAPVTPGTRLDHSLIIMSKNGMRSSKRKINRTATDILSTRPHESAECCNDLVESAACHLDQIRSKLHLLSCLRVSENMWKVKPLKKQTVCTYVPVFYRVRTVSLQSNGKLLCSCPRTDVYGDICIHALKVASLIPGFKGPSYQDYSVVWWKKFYHLISQTDTDGYNENCRTLSRTMLLLKHKEKIGIQVSLTDFPDFEDNVTQAQKEEFQYNGDYPVVLNRNYFYCQELPRLLEKESNKNDDGAPPGMSQVSNVSLNPSDHDETVNTFVVNGLTIDKALEDLPGHNIELDPYAYLIQSFKELTNVYKGNATSDDLQEVKRFFSEKVGFMKKKINGDKKPVGRIVSCNVKCSKRRRTHGSKIYSRK